MWKITSTYNGKQISSYALTLSSITYKKISIYLKKNCLFVELRAEKISNILFDKVKSTFPWFQNFRGSISIIVISEYKR